MDWNKCIIIFLLIFSFEIENSFAQFSKEEQMQIDSLNSIILSVASHDTAISHAYVGITEIVSDFDTILALCEKAKVIAERNLKIKNINSKVKVSFQRTLADALNNIGYVQQNKGNNASAIDYYSRSLKIREGIKDKKGVASSLNNIGGVHLNQGNINLAIDYFSMSLKIREEIGDKGGIAYCLNNLGYIYQNQGDIPLAIDYFSKSLKIREEIKDKYGIALSLNNLAYLYKDRGDIPLALDYYSRSLKIREEIGDKEGIAYSLNNIGFIYQRKGNLPLALDYYLKSLKIREEIGDKEGIAASLNNIGTIYQKQGKSMFAIENYSRALAITKEIEDKKGIATSLLNLGKVYFDKGEFSTAQKFASRSLAVAKELGFPENIGPAAGILNSIYRKTNRYDQALEMYELQIAMRDSINNKETEKAKARQQFKYAYEKKAAKDSIRNSEEKKVKDAQIYAQKAQIKQEETKRFALYGGLFLVLGFSGYTYNRFRLISNQKKTIEDQKAEVDEKNIALFHSRQLLEERHKEITDSIHYANRIQTALLKEEEYITYHLPPHFILFKPKDILSGDFYWTLEKQDHLYLAAADCTGHGVPGAMMSMLGIAFLNEITGVETLQNPAEILDQLRDKIIKHLKSKDGVTKDGMDISLICLNLKTKQLQWAGANNPLWIVRAVILKEETVKEFGSEKRIRPMVGNTELELIEVKANKQPIGFFHAVKPFTNHEISLAKGDSIYLFTDGFADQFGGDKGKKFKYANLKELLLSTTNKPMQEQKEILNHTFENWKGNLEQVDDVCVIGVKI